MRRRRQTFRRTPKTSLCAQKPVSDDSISDEDDTVFPNSAVSSDPIHKQELPLVVRLDILKGISNQNLFAKGTSSSFEKPLEDDVEMPDFNDGEVVANSTDEENNSADGGNTVISTRKLHRYGPQSIRNRDITRVSEPFLHSRESVSASHTTCSKANTSGIWKAKPIFSLATRSHKCGGIGPSIPNIDSLPELIKAVGPRTSANLDGNHLEDDDKIEINSDIEPAETEALPHGFNLATMNAHCNNLQDKANQLLQKSSRSHLQETVVDSEDSSEPVESGSSSDNETMAERFVEALGTSSVTTEGTHIGAINSLSAGLFGKLQQMMLKEKETDMNFWQKLQAGARPDSQPGCIDVKIISRYHDGKLTVCHCSFGKYTEIFEGLSEKSDGEKLCTNLHVCSRKDSLGAKACVYGIVLFVPFRNVNYPICNFLLQDSSKGMGFGGSKRSHSTIIFSPRVCNNVNLHVGNVIRIHPPWKDVQVFTCWFLRYGTCRYIEQVVELYYFPSILLLALYPRHHKRFIFPSLSFSICGGSYLAGALIAPIAFVTIGTGNSAVIIGLWSAHVFWTYYCVAGLYFSFQIAACYSIDLCLQFLFTLLNSWTFDNRTNRFGPVFKVVVLMCLPVPLLLSPIVGIVGSLLGGIGYGFFAPLLATFQAVGKGEAVNKKVYHCFNDGCWSTIERSCTVVQDVTDFCFHSYFSYMDELRENLPPHEKPLDIRLSILPCCLLVIIVGVPFDMALITLIAIWKSPYMLFRGWKRLLEDLIGRKGPFLETECVPFAALAIILWPLAVVVAVLAATFCSPFLALYSGVVVHQEDSVKMGFAYIVSVVSHFDEYVNDLLYLREGSCFPRPVYQRNSSHAVERENPVRGDDDLKHRRDGSQNSKHALQQSRSLKWRIQQYRPVQVWDWLFKSCAVNGRILLRDRLISVGEIEECILKGNCKKLSIKLPAWSLLQCLLTTAKSKSDGLVISEDVVLTRMNGPKDKVFEWFIEPLLVMKEQLKKLELEETEETCLMELVMKCKNELPEEWDSTGFPSDDTVRRAQLQAIIRRKNEPNKRHNKRARRLGLEPFKSIGLLLFVFVFGTIESGIVASMSRIPTFRRRFRNLIKVLYIEALQAGASAGHIGGTVIHNLGENIKEANVDEATNKC
ncbi:unnamed protein product [Sphenostylis stenocarpa]|uniref:Transmembrane protein n=1 Tax=Sphenostylis stenocarpa TaxID=92480 RepID=A0AA86SQ08_9FABA|nr:unnamed protein product [Sphenostylis stenocarpa]